MERNQQLLAFLVIAAGCMALFSACSPSLPGVETLERYARAAGLYSEGRFAETARLLTALGPFPPALVLRGKAEYFAGEGEAAEGLFRRVLRKRPGAAEASLYLARILRERGKTGEALALVETVLGDDPSDLRALRLAADLSLEQGPAGEAAAIGFLDRGAEAASEAALVFLDRARLRWIAGKGPEALGDLARAKVLLPDGSPLFRGLETLESRIKEYLE